MFRSIVFNVAFYITFVVEAVLFSPVLLLPERFGWPVVHVWAASSLWLHRVICGVSEEIRGRENIPSGALLVAAKHQSAWETLRLVGLFERPTFVLKRELLWIPLFGWYLWKFGQIPVDRGKRTKALAAMTEGARKAVAEGRQIIIFPEGTRRPPLAPPAYRYGVVHLYRSLGVPCLPVALNSGLFWPRRSMVHRKGTITLACLPAIPPGLESDVFGRTLKERLETETRMLVQGALDRDPSLAAEDIVAEPQAGS
nr:lysophospholipid acyltransferase family protein [Propylenella binzhouense]